MSIVIIKKNLTKILRKLMTKLCITYKKLTTTLEVSRENVKFAESDVFSGNPASEAAIGRIL